MEYHSRGTKKIPHSLSVVPGKTFAAITILPYPSVLSSAMTKHAETPSVPVRSEHDEETETMVDINPPSTSTVTDVTTATLQVSPVRSTGNAPSNSHLAKDLKLNPASIRTDDFADF